MICRDCIWYSRCALERRGICTDFKEKHGQSASHKIKRGGVNEQIRNREQSKN